MNRAIKVNKSIDCACEAWSYLLQFCEPKLVEVGILGSKFDFANFARGDDDQVLVDWCQWFPALEHGIDIPHCQFFESHVTMTISVQDPCIRRVEWLRLKRSSSVM